jgi:separase
VTELKEELKTRGLPIGGKKADLVGRLKEHISQARMTSDGIYPAADPSTPLPATQGLFTPAQTLMISASNVPLSSNTTGQSPSTLAIGHFTRAFEICRKLADPTMLKDVCSGLVLLQRDEDPTQTAFYLHIGLGITARQEMLIKLLRDGRKQTNGATADVMPKHTPSSTEQLYSFSGIQSPSDFRRDYVDKLPTDLTVCSISLDPSGKSLIISRLQKGATPTVQLLPIPIVAPFGAAKKIGPALKMVTEELVDVLATSEDVIGTAKEVLATTDVEEKGRLMSEWWSRRGQLDDRLEAMLGVLETAVLGSGKTMLLGKLDNPMLEELVQEEAGELQRGLLKLTENGNVSLPLCERLVDGMLEGLTSKAEVRAALKRLVGTTNNDIIEAARDVLRPIKQRLATACPSAKTGRSGAHDINEAGDAGASGQVPCTPRVGRVKIKMPSQTPRVGLPPKTPSASRTAHLDRAPKTPGLAPKTPSAARHLDHAPSFGLAPKTPSVSRISNLGRGAPPMMGMPPSTPSASRAPPTTIKKAFGRKQRIVGPQETPVPLSFARSDDAPPPIIPFTPANVAVKKKVQKSRLKSAAAGTDAAAAATAPTIFVDEQPAAPTVVRKPICLILDKAVQSLPWESMPILQGAAVSRMPSLPFIVDRAAGAGVDAADSKSKKKKKTGTKKKATFEDAAALSTAPPVHNIDGRRTYYVLNPGKDLKSTQRAFESKFAANEGWSGVVGRAPTADEYKAALVDSDVVVYCGHGAGQSFLNENQLEAAQCRATTLLMGCSSGRLRDAGDFEPSGMALKYLLAGAPAVVANLWDVTDKDIDAVTAAILEDWGSAEDDAGLLNVVSHARDKCRLRFINGAAPVVYGLQVTRTSTTKPASA